MWVPLFELCDNAFETLVQIRIDKYAIKVSRGLSVLELFCRVAQTCCNGIFTFRAPSPQTLFQFFSGRWRNENVMGIQTAKFHFLNALNVNVEDANLAL